MPSSYERLAEKKRIKSLTSVVRGVKTKQRKFKALKSEALSEARSVLKALKSPDEKLKERLAHLNTLLLKFSNISEDFAFEVTFEFLDFESIIEDVDSSIVSLKETTK